MGLAGICLAPISVDGRFGWCACRFANWDVGEESTVDRNTVYGRRRCQLGVRLPTTLRIDRCDRQNHLYHSHCSYVIVPFPACPWGHGESTILNWQRDSVKGGAKIRAYSPEINSPF